MSFVGPVDLLLRLAKQSVSVVIDVFINRVYPTCDAHSRVFFVKRFLYCAVPWQGDTILTQCVRSSIANQNVNILDYPYIEINYCSFELAIVE